MADPVQFTLQVQITQQQWAQIDRQLERALAQAVYATGVEIEGNGKAECPVDTGLLRSSIRFEMTGPVEGEVGAFTDYAAAVHEGYHTQAGTYVAGRPYLRGPAERAAPRFRRRVEALLP